LGLCVAAALSLATLAIYNVFSVASSGHAVQIPEPDPDLAYDECGKGNMVIDLVDHLPGHPCNPLPEERD
jgi:hypothetical protein